MRVVLSSERFAFATAKTLFVRTDMSVAVEGQCYEDVIADLNIDAAGAYNLWLSDIELRSLSTGKSFAVNGILFPWVVEFTQKNLDEGTITVASPAGGVFRITVIDRRHVPVPNYKLILASSGDRTVDCATLEIVMDGQGICVTYDNPTRGCIIIDPGLGILIEHLDTSRE